MKRLTKSNFLCRRPLLLPFQYHFAIKLHFYIVNIVQFTASPWFNCSEQRLLIRTPLFAGSSPEPVLFGRNLNTTRSSLGVERPLCHLFAFPQLVRNCLTHNKQFKSIFRILLISLLALTIHIDDNESNKETKCSDRIENCAL